MIGKTLAHYEIVALLGKGGMGEVYRAHDTKLGRDVALKVLPPELARDTERVARFAREARTLASLQHPNIASIYGFEEAEGVRFLTMELAEGEDLSEVLSREKLPLDEALRIARQIATGLEAAHDKGIVHRDLKPANVKVGSDGSVKILDFGLARAYVGDGADGGDPEHSPTITAAMTHAGVILGTAAYMSPEQARGRATDSRADIWAFGVVLFEMIAGQRLFSGETVSDTLASVLKTEVDWSLLPADLPPRIRTLLVRCLDRDRDRRLRDVGEARILLADELSGAPDAHLESALHSGVIGAATGASGPAPGRVRWWTLGVAALVGAALALAILRVVAPATPSAPPLRKLLLENPEMEDRVSIPAISPDGRSVAFLTPTHIVLRELSARELRRFPLSEPAQDLFWSPDSRNLGYVISHRLMRLDALSGQQQVVCEAQGSFTGGSGATWGDDGTIVFSQADDQGLFRVSDRGGDPRLVLPLAEAEQDLHDPCVLPGNRGVLFVPHKSSDPFAEIVLWTGDERRTVVRIPGQSLEDPVYSPTGHLLFHRSPTNPGIWAVPFDLDRLETTGEPFLVASSGSYPSVSGDGTLVYRSGSNTGSLRLTWNDPTGRELADAGEVPLQAGYTFPTVTPSGKLASATVDDGENPDLWVFDLDRGTRTRLTFGEGREEWPSWTPSGDAVLYHIRPAGTAGIDSMRVLRVPADGTGQPDTLAVGFVANASPDGKFFAYSQVFDDKGWSQADLAYGPMDGDRSQVERLAGATGLQMDPQVAPGGEFVAYTSNESGRYEIYLTRFPSGEGRWQVSIDGGMWPRWDGEGGRLFYARGNDILVVSVTLGPSPGLGRPEVLFERPELSMPTVVGWAPGFDVSADAQRFVYFRDPEVRGQDHQVVVVQSWVTEFRDPR